MQKFVWAASIANLAIWLTMSAKHRFRERYRIELREKDHAPPHVHLTGGGLDVMIGLQPIVVLQGAAPAAVLKDALRWVEQHVETLVEEWKLWHP